MYALQDYRCERDAEGGVTIYGRVERHSPETGLWEVVYDATAQGIWYPEFWDVLTAAEQDSILQTVAPRILLMAAGVEG